MERVIALHRMKDEEGNIHEVEEIQEYVNAADLDGPSWLEGRRRLELDDGTAVNFIDANTFGIVATGQLIRRA